MGFKAGTDRTVIFGRSRSRTGNIRPQPKPNFTKSIGGISKFSDEFFSDFYRFFPIFSIVSDFFRFFPNFWRRMEYADILCGNDQNDDLHVRHHSCFYCVLLLSRCLFRVFGHIGRIFGFGQILLKFGPKPNIRKFGRSRSRMFGLSLVQSQTMVAPNSEKAEYRIVHEYNFSLIRSNWFSLISVDLPEIKDSRSHVVQSRPFSKKYYFLANINIFFEKRQFLRFLATFSIKNDLNYSVFGAELFDPNYSVFGAQLFGIRPNTE